MSDPAAFGKNMNRITLLALLAIVAVTLSACVEVSRYSVVHTESGYSFDVRRDYKGVSFGMCGPITGAYTERGLIVAAKKNHYDASEIVEYYQGKRSTDQFTSGYLEVDWKRSRINIKLMKNDRPFDLNGSFKIKTEPNQAPEPTPMLVTPRASARVAPSTGAAHL